MYLFSERERESKCEVEAQRERERETQGDSALSAEPKARLSLMTLRSRPDLELRCLTNSTTQAPPKQFEF